MTSAVVTLAMISIGGSSLALADPPVTPAAPETQSNAAQSSNTDDSTGQSSAAHAAAAPATAAAPQTPAAAAAKPAASTSAPSPPDERMMEQQLRLQGYRLSMVRGQERYCRREAPLGSRLESVMHCVTLAEAEIMAHEGKETTERIQRNQPGCLMPAQGGCGK
jgi:hypothetical protein